MQESIERNEYIYICLLIMNKYKYFSICPFFRNDTVANLTLMALGSSAPEILLSIIEIVGNRFEAGELGPGTIVGEESAFDFHLSYV